MRAGPDGCPNRTGEQRRRCGLRWQRRRRSACRGRAAHAWCPLVAEVLYGLRKVLRRKLQSSRAAAGGGEGARVVTGAAPMQRRSRRTLSRALSRTQTSCVTAYARQPFPSSHAPNKGAHLVRSHRRLRERKSFALPPPPSATPRPRAAPGRKGPPRPPPLLPPPRCPPKGTATAPAMARARRPLSSSQSCARGCLCPWSPRRCSSA